MNEELKGLIMQIIKMLDIEFMKIKTDIMLKSPLIAIVDDFDNRIVETKFKRQDDIDLVNSIHTKCLESIYNEVEKHAKIKK